MGPGARWPAARLTPRLVCHQLADSGPSPRLQALRKAGASLVCRSQFPNRTGQPGPEKVPRARGRWVPRELPWTSWGLKGQKGPRKQDAGLCSRFSRGVGFPCTEGRQPVGKPGLSAQALVVAWGPDSVSLCKHSESDAAESSVTSDLVTVLALCVTCPPPCPSLSHGTIPSTEHGACGVRSTCWSSARAGCDCPGGSRQTVS